MAEPEAGIMHADFHLHSLSGKILENAKRLGYTTLGVLGDLTKTGELELLRGAELNPQNSSQLKNRQKKEDYTLLHAKSADLLRDAEGLVDIVSLDLENLVYDLVIARELKNTFVEFNLHPIVFGQKRMQAINNLSKALDISRKSKNRVLITLHPENEFELRSKEDLGDFLEYLGFTQKERKQALEKNPQDFIKEIKDRKTRVQEGVRVLE